MYFHLHLTFTKSAHVFYKNYGNPSPSATLSNLISVGHPLLNTIHG